MKIIFESEEEKKVMGQRFSSMGYCPSHLDLEEDCREECEECWRMALAELEVEEQ